MTDQRAKRTEAKAEYVRRTFTNVGSRYDVSPLEPEHDAPPSGTTDYPGRMVAFTVTDHDRTYRIVIEDVTLDA